MNVTAVVGKHTAAVGSPDIITGQAKYTTDIYLPEMLVGKLLYTEYPCARIVNIDVSRARALPGVVTVLTGEDIPGENSYKLYDTDQPVLVTDYVRYQGDAVVAVAAEDEAAAQAALDAAEVEYEPRPGVYDVLAAMEADALQVWPHRDNNSRPSANRTRRYRGWFRTRRRHYRGHLYHAVYGTGVSGTRRCRGSTGAGRNHGCLCWLSGAASRSNAGGPITRAT